MLYIHYLFGFWKNIVDARVLINSSSKINVIMISAYASILGLKVYFYDIGTQKIDGSTLEKFEIVLANFQVDNKLRKTRFFQETFLLADINVEVILSIFFLTLNNTDIQFAEKRLTNRSYTTAKVLSMTKQVELINKKKFAKVALNENSEIFVTYVIFLALILVYSDRKT